MCRGVTSSDGSKQYNKDNKGRIELPRSEAHRILNSGHRDARAYRPTMSVGMATAYEDDYQAFLAQSETFVPYATWYREHKKGA